MPRVSMKNSHFVRKVHLKFETMAPKTLIKYRVAVRLFFLVEELSRFFLSCRPIGAGFSGG